MKMKIKVKMMTYYNEKNGHSVYYDVETMKRNSKIIQKGEGIF